MELLERLKDMPGAALGAGAALLLGVGGKVGLALAKRLLPVLLTKLVRNLVTKGVSADKPHARNLVKAAVLFVEAETPDRGQGREKWERVVTMLGIGKHERELVELIEAVVGNVDEELKKLGS